MAGRAQHTHDGGTMERRLRPIYDWLDSGNNKKALQEAEKVLKKSPSSQTARALKALSLLRLGKSSEAESVLITLVEESPNDDSTLQAMTMSYKETHQLNKVCELYEKAVKVDGGNEELHSHLFMSYVRIGDFKSQQRSALALYKSTPKNPYYFWAVMSIVLQAREAEDPKQRSILISLAQRMVENFISENKIEAEQELRLYILILEQQEKWEDIIKFMEGPLYTRIIGSVPQGSIPYLKHLKQWRKLNILCKDLLVDSPDRWDYYLPYLETVFELNNLPTEDNKADDTFEKCHEFIGQLIEGRTNEKPLRGPYLARLELWKRLTEKGDDTSLLGKGWSLCVQYLMIFAHKNCAILDLKQYISLIPQEEREEHCLDFLKCTGLDENSEPDNPDDIQRHISCIGAWRICAPPLPAAGALNLAVKMNNQYLRALNSGLVTSTDTEFCSAEGYALLAAHHFFYAAAGQNSSVPILKALCLLELVLHKSPSNFHIKLMLINLYHLLGNALAADTIYQRLQVKHIQLLSMGWIHAARLAPACALHRALQLLADTKAFHDHHGKDCMDHLTYSYKYGTFDKLLELVAWNNRIRNCWFSASVATERQLLSVLAGPTPNHTTIPLPTEPTDNRDLNVMINWEPPQLKDPNLKEFTQDQELAYLRLKDGLVTAIGFCIQLADTRPIEDKKIDYTKLMICANTLADAISICKNKYCERPRLSLCEPFPSRIIAFVNSPVPYRELYLFTLRMVGELALHQWKEMHNVCQHVEELVSRSNEIVRQILDERLRANDVLWSMREILEHISNYLEYLGVVTFVLAVCHDMQTPNSLMTKKSKKIKTKSPEEVKTSELLLRLNLTVQHTAQFIEAIFEQLPTFSTKISIDKQLEELSLIDGYTCCVQSKLRNGFCDMSNEVIAVLKKKLTFLKYLEQ